LRFLWVELPAEILPQLEGRFAWKNQLDYRKEIAEELDELVSDDAADIISELPQHKKKKCVRELEFRTHKDIVIYFSTDRRSWVELMERTVWWTWSSMGRVNSCTFNICCERRNRLKGFVTKRF
jgi:DNA topoisomerase IA